jgi:hypothetical protein
MNLEWSHSRLIVMHALAIATVVMHVTIVMHSDTRKVTYGSPAKPPKSMTRVSSPLREGTNFLSVNCEDAAQM